MIEALKKKIENFIEYAKNDMDYYANMYKETGNDYWNGKDDEAELHIEFLKELLEDYIKEDDLISTIKKVEKNIEGCFEKLNSPLKLDGMSGLRGSRGPRRKKRKVKKK